MRTAAASADDDRLSLTISGFRPSSNTGISAGADDVVGQQIDVEDTFNLARNRRARVSTACCDWPTATA